MPTIQQCYAKITNGDQCTKTLLDSYGYCTQYHSSNAKFANPNHPQSPLAVPIRVRIERPIRQHRQYRRQPRQPRQPRQRSLVLIRGRPRRQPINHDSSSSDNGPIHGEIFSDSDSDNSIIDNHRNISIDPIDIVGNIMIPYIQSPQIGYPIKSNITKINTVSKDISIDILNKYIKAVERFKPT
jgi:hypothetical protein